MMERSRQLILRLTNRCNLACRYCYAACDGLNGDSGGSDMTFETARKAIDLFAQPGDRLRIQFTGGEPLLCVDLMAEIFDYVKKAGIQIRFSLQTNGTLLTAENCKLLKGMNCAVGVSLDGMGEANGLRVYPDGRETVGDVTDGIGMLRSMGMFCNLNAVVTGRNQRKLPELFELAAYLGNVRGIGLDMFRPLGRGRDASLLYREDLVTLMRESPSCKVKTLRGDRTAAERKMSLVRPAAGGEFRARNSVLSPDVTTLGDDILRMLETRAELEALGVKLRLKELEKVRVMLREGARETCYCYAQTGDSAAVDPQGDIYPCSSFVGQHQMRMGNIETGFHYIEEKVPGMDGACVGCEDAAICRGGCPAGRWACGGCSEADCLMHRTVIQYGRKEYAKVLMPDRYR